MARSMMPTDDGDGVQYDTEYAPSAAQLEADEIRRDTGTRGKTCRCNGCRYCDPCCCTNTMTGSPRAAGSAERLARYARGDVGYRLLG
jgi:hypothetical protein